MDVDLLSKMIKELILDKDRVVLPGLGCFVAEMVPSTFSDKGYTINPPYRKLSFRSKPDMGDELIDFYVEANGLDREVACRILGDFIGELRQVIFTKKVVMLPGLGRLRATKENHLFFIPDENLDIYPAGVGLEPISLKTHVETQEEVAAALSDLKSIMSDVQPVEKTLEEQPIVEPAPEVEPEPAPEVEPEPAPEVEPAPAPEPEPELKPEVASEHAEPVESPKKKRSAGMKFLLTIVIVLSIILILLAAYMIVARQIPGIFDTILYTPEELQILNYKL